MSTWGWHTMFTIEKTVYCLVVAGVLSTGCHPADSDDGSERAGGQMMDAGGVTAGSGGEMVGAAGGEMVVEGPHWAVVGLQYSGDDTHEVQTVPPSTALAVAADQALTITAVTETHDYCHGERMETDPICCVSNYYPEAIIDGQAITVRVRVDLGDVPCMGSIGPQNYGVSIPALSAGTYELTALGRDDVGLPDLKISLVVE